MKCEYKKNFPDQCECRKNDASRNSAGTNCYVSDGDDVEKTPEFYKKFYDENMVKLLQYKSLRDHFNELIDNVLGADYYNMAMDVYEADRICCEDIELRAKSFWSKLFNT
ncbi:MAG: hypothetical protein DRP02_14065 [Candidatus Gerdarchaeota archaeon]|nr:MAG: hypothetical protein DRP02_14065 [Candidatus Gerdarchaeota archaeon]